MLSEEISQTLLRSPQVACGSLCNSEALLLDDGLTWLRLPSGKRYSNVTRGYFKCASLHGFLNQVHFDRILDVQKCYILYYCWETPGIIQFDELGPWTPNSLPSYYCMATVLLWALDKCQNWARDTMKEEEKAKKLNLISQTWPPLLMSVPGWTQVNIFSAHWSLWVTAMPRWTSRAGAAVYSPSATQE